MGIDSKNKEKKLYEAPKIEEVELEDFPEVDDFSFSEIIAYAS